MMQPDDREHIYWALSEIAEGEPLEDTLVPESTLVAYRNGELTAAEAREVEGLLVRNPANRRRLEAVAGATPTDAPKATRIRILEAVIPSTSWFPARQHRQRLLAVAAVIVLVITFSWWVRRPVPGPPAYQVTIAALAERRDSATPDLIAEAYGDSRVTITATVTERAVDGVGVGVYRRVEDRLERLKIGDSLQLEERPGALRFSALAADLVGPEAGVHKVFVVIAWREELPAAIRLEPEDDPATSLAGGHRQVHQLTLRLLAENSATSINDQPSR